MKIQILIILLGYSSGLYCYQSQSDRRQPRKYALKEQFYWGIPDFKFPNATARNNALSTGSYIPDKNVIWSMGVWRNKIFVAAFRFRIGVASSFNYFSMNSTKKSPVLIPYPSFDENYVNEDPLHRTVGIKSNRSIISVAYFRIDKCDRLWVIDTGLNNFFGEIRVITVPALVIFDLKTNTLIRRYTIPAEFYNSNSVFVNLDIDLNGSGCDDAYAYITDLFRSIVVYSLKKNRSWRLVHNLFGSEPSNGIFRYEGLNIQWDFGALAINVGELHSDGSKRVYISPFASTKTYYISNKILQNEDYIAANDYYYDVHLLGDRDTRGQIYTAAYDRKTETLFDTQFNRLRITCWNTANPYKNSSFAVVYKSKLQTFFPGDVRVDNNRNLWVLDSKLPKFAFGTWVANAKNIQMFKAKVDDVIAETVCEHKLPVHKPKPCN